MPLIIAEQGTREWLEARRDKITASIAAACLGLHPHMGLFKAYMLITGKSNDLANPHIRWGRRYEATARFAYECESGNIVYTTGFWLHDKYNWLGASPDGFAGDDGLVEIKCPNLEKIPDDVPEYHRIQCQVQMAVVNRAWCDYFVWTPQKTWTKRVPRLNEYDETCLLMRLFAWYTEYIASKKSPPRRRKKNVPEIQEIEETS